MEFTEEFVIRVFDQFSFFGGPERLRVDLEVIRVVFDDLPGEFEKLQIGMEAESDSEAFHINSIVATGGGMVPGMQNKKSPDDRSGRLERDLKFID